MTSKAAQERFKAQQAAKTLPEKEDYSAKQAAMRLATDARTFRKFLRSSHCSFEAVGQGKRYEFTHDELMKLRDEFIEWREYCEARRTTTDRIKPEARAAEAATKPVPITEIEPNPEFTPPNFDDLEGPSEEDLVQLDGVDYDDF
jgi:hypothetical protein